MIDRRHVAEAELVSSDLERYEHVRKFDVKSENLD